MQIELRQREEMRGPMADGLLLGLWIGEVFGAAEYWLIRGASLALTVTHRFLRRPLLVATLVGSAFAGFLCAHTFAMLSDARVRSAALDIKTIENGAKLFAAAEGRWPGRLEDLVPRSLRELHTDPWGHNYVLSRGEGGIAIISAGPDGVLGTGDDLLRVMANPPPAPSRAHESKCCEFDASIPGLRIAKAQPRLLANAGLESTDVIRSLDGIPIDTDADMRAAVARARDARVVVDVQVEIVRRGEPLNLAIPRETFLSLVQEP